MYRAIVTLATIGSVLSATMPALQAQNQAALDDIVGKMQKLLDDPKPIFLRETITVAVGGQVQEEITQDAWMVDLEHVRLERADGTVMLYTPEEIKLFVGPTKVMLHVPQETLEALGDDRWEHLGKVDISEPSGIFGLLIEEREHLKVTGEDEIAGEECVVVTAAEEILPRFRDLLAGIPEEFTPKMVQVSLGRRSAAPLGLYIEFAGPAQLELGAIVEEVEENAHIPEDVLTFEPPEDATVLTWTPDRTADQMRAEFQELTGRGG